MVGLPATVSAVRPRHGSWDRLSSGCQQRSDDDQHDAHQSNDRYLIVAEHHTQDQGDDREDVRYERRSG